MTQVLRALLITLVLALAVGAALWLVQGDVTGLRRPALAFFETWWEGVPPENAMAKSFESVASKEAMEKMLKLYKGQLGAYESAGETLEEWTREGEGHISIELVFAKATGIGRWEFVQEAGQWKVRRFHIDLPRRQPMSRHRSGDGMAGIVGAASPVRPRVPQIARRDPVETCGRGAGV